MKINGSLVFDGSGLSQITNLRVEKLAALPTFVTADIGRLAYVTGSQTLYMGGATEWLPLATGGDAASLATELDAVETSLGGAVNADGTYNAAAFTGTLAGSTSITNVLLTLQSLIATATSGLAQELLDRAAADTALQTAIANEVTRATTAEGVLQTAIDAEEAARIAADGVLQTAIDDEEAARIAGDATNAGLVTAEETARIAADGVLQTAIDDEETRALAAETALDGRVTTEVNRATAAEAALDGRITTEVSDRTAAVNGVAADLATEVTDRIAADTALQTAIDQEVTRATGQEAAIRGELASALVGLSWEAPVDLLATTASAVDISGVANGYRIVDLTTFTVYTVTDGVLDAGEALEDGAAFFNRTNDIGYTFNGTEVVPFSGAASFVAGAGLAMAGNTVNVGNSDGSITVTADNIAISASVRTEITNNAAAVAAEVTRAQTAEAGLDDRIDDEVQARADALANEVAARNAAILVETDRAAAAEAALQTAIANEVTRATTAEGLLQTALDGVTTDFEAGDLALQTALGAEVIRATNAEDAVEAALAQEVLDRAGADTALQTAIDAVELSISKLYFLYDGAASATHTVAHNLGQKYCNVTVVDGDDEVVIPQSITFNNTNTLTVTFNSSIVCKVIVMGYAAV